MALTCAMDGGDPAVGELVERMGAQAAWNRIIEGALGDAAARRARGTQLDLVDRLAVATQTRFVVPGDEEWPRSLDDLAETEAIQRRGGRPTGLWLRGPGHLAELVARSVAIVGSRAATNYGKGVASDLASDLADLGVTIISGGAHGIDRSAHDGALAVDGRTVGVVANGVDVAYPPGNTKLFEVLGRHHLLVSELPPGAHPTRVRFLARNRMIAAMAQGTVVVEAALRSGARNTAGWALECQRPLMAVPGPVFSQASTAPHLMIRNGQATLVTSAADVLEMISEMGSHTVSIGQGPLRPTDGLSEGQLAVFEAVPARRRSSVGEIALAASASVPGTLAALTMLESIGLVEGDERGWLATP